MAVLKSQIVLGNFVQSFIDFLFFSSFHTKEEKSLKNFLFFWKKQLSLACDYSKNSTWNLNNTFLNISLTSHLIPQGILQENLAKHCYSHLIHK